MPLRVPASQPEPGPEQSTPLQPVAPSPKRFPGAMPDGTTSVGTTELWIGVHLLSESADQTSSSQQQQLERLAVSAQRFTPRVSLVPPDGLVLEVKGSLHLFNGVEGLSRALASECAALGLKSAVALAPTPLAALVAARVGKPGRAMGQPGRAMGQPGRAMGQPGRAMGQPVPAGDFLPSRAAGASRDSLADRSVDADRSVGQPFVVTELTRLVGQLTPFSLAVLRWPQETLERLARMGVRTIGQALRLPRAGFARRFGTEALATLDRLTGRSPDLRDRYRARDRFRRRRELTYELENHTAILNELVPLLAELGKFLEARQCGVMKLECLLRHRHAEPTRCVLRLAAPVADVRRITELLGERLSALTLPEPVRGCELRSSSLVPRVLTSNSVWQPGEHGGAAGAEAPELIERLRARLGPEAVYGLHVLPGHRPESVWAVTEPALAARSSRSSSVAASTPWPPFRRPLWLLPAPQLLSERDGLPRRRGPLQLHGEPERIETGWWDGGDIARDYFTATDLHGVRLWIFREREVPHRWFLHGVFG